MPSLGLVYGVKKLYIETLRILLCQTSPGSSFVNYQWTYFDCPGLFWLLWLSMVAVSDRVAIKSVGSQLTVPISLDIRWNSYTRLLFKKCIVSKWRNPFLLRIKFVDGLVGNHNFGGFKVREWHRTLFCYLCQTCSPWNWIL